MIANGIARKPHYKTPRSLNHEDRYPREIKNHEYRVAITPAGVHELARRGHQVVIESGAGVGSSFADDDFKAAGAQILSNADEVWETAELLLKVKEPIAEEYPRLREGQVLFTYLGASSRSLTSAAMNSAKSSAIAGVGGVCPHACGVHCSKSVMVFMR